MKFLEKTLKEYDLEHQRLKNGQDVAKQNKNDIDTKKRKEWREKLQR